MPLRWKLFRTICIVQLLLASFRIMEALFHLFRYASFRSFAALFLFTGIMLLCVLGINLVSNNWPDEPVDGRQKKNFNRLYLVNFFSLSFLVGFIVAEYRSLHDLSLAAGKPLTEFPFSLFIMLILYLTVLVFQLVILYSLYRLRLELYSNFRIRKFEFENT